MTNKKEEAINLYETASTDDREIVKRTLTKEGFNYLSDLITSGTLPILYRSLLLVDLAVRDRTSVSTQLLELMVRHFDLPVAMTTKIRALIPLGKLNQHDRYFDSLGIGEFSEFFDSNHERVIDAWSFSKNNRHIPEGELIQRNLLLTLH